MRGVYNLKHINELHVSRARQKLIELTMMTRIREMFVVYKKKVSFRAGQVKIGSGYLEMWGNLNGLWYESTANVEPKFENPTYYWACLCWSPNCYLVCLGLIHHWEYIGYTSLLGYPNSLKGNEVDRENDRDSSTKTG